MKTIRIAIGCLLLMAGTTFAQTQTISLFTSGTSNTSGSANPSSTFSLDTNLTFSGYTAEGLSYWLEVPNALAPFISITSETYFTFTDPTNTGVKVFNTTSGADSGFMADQTSGGATSGDLGGTSSAGGGVAAGTYQVSTLNFTLSGAPAGTYTIQTTSISPRRSVASEPGTVGGTTHGIPTARYTLTVVPEPATWSLFGLGALGALGITSLRARRRS